MRKFDFQVGKPGRRLVRKGCAAVLACMLLLQYIPFSAGAFNGFSKPLVYNGDFEETGTYAAPAGWCYKKQSESGSLKLESGNGAEGQYVRMEPADGAALLETAGVSLIALEGGECYTLTFRAYSYGQLHLEMEMYTADGTVCGEDLSTEGCLVSAEAEWVKRTLSFRADEEARYLLLRFAAENGAAGVDAVALKRSSAKETAARMMPLYTAGTPTNQLTNGDFSAYTVGTDGQVTALTDWELGSLHGCGVAVQEGTKYGNALEITIPASITYNPRLRHTATNLQAGKTYEFSYWIKTTAASAADARVYLVLRKSDLTGSAVMLTSNPDTRVSVTNGGWKRMYFEYTVPDGYDNTVIDFQFEKKGKEVTYSFADFTVTEPVEDAALLQNGDFARHVLDENGNILVLKNWDITSLNGCGLTVDTDAAHGYALQVQVPASIPYNPRLRHTATNLQAGKTYEFSYWIKTTAASAADARVYLVLRKSDLTGSAIMLTSNPDTRVSVTNGGWKRMYFEYTVPDSYDNTVIDFQFEKKGKEVTYSFADFTVTEPETDTAPIQNGDFARHVLDENGNILVLKNWDMTSLNGCGLTLGSDAAHGATLDMAVPASIGYAPRLRHTATNLQEGKTYEFSYWVSTNVADAALAEIYMVLRKADLTGEAIAFTSADTYDSRVRATDGQWKLVCFDYTIPAGYGNAVVDFQIGRKNAVTYRLAAVSAQEIDRDTALITNGDFSRYRLDETGALLSLSDWKTEYLGQAKSYGLERDAERGMALKVVNSNKKSCNFSHLPTSMREGETYKITYWVKTDATVSADANTYLVLQKKKYTSNADNIILTTSAGSDVNTAVYATNGAWRKVTAFVQIPAGWDQAALMIVIANRPDSSRAETTYWYAGFTAEQKADPGDNLDFESDDVDAENWSAATSGTGDIRIAAGESYNGSNALCVANGGRLGITYAASRKLAVKPSATYEITYWAKLTGTSDANGWIQPVQYNASGKPANGASFDKDATDNRLQKISGDITYRWEWRMVGDTAWTRVKRAFTVANDAAYIYLRFLTSGAGTEFYIDDITLREITPTQNFDFEETDGDGMPSYWYFTDARATEATVETDETYYHSGRRSVHITKASLTSYNAFETAYRFLVLPGNTYEFSFWMASRNASPHLNLRLNMVYYDDNGNRVYKPDGSHSITYGTMTYLNSGSSISEWTQVMTRSVVPEGASSAVLQFYSQEGEYELWLDDIFVDIVENEKDVIAEHNDFHAVDQDGNIAGWQLRSVTGSSDFRADEGCGTLVNRSGENYMEFTTAALETAYQYYLVGKYKTDTDAVAEMHFSDWAGRPVETDAVTAALPANGDWTVFELSFTAPSCTTAQLRIGTRSPGTVQVDDILIYMVGKPVTAGDWKGNWVWFQEEATTDALYQSRYFRYEINLDAEPQFCPLQFTADDRYTLYVNGTEIASNMGASGDTWSSVQVAYLEPYLKKGRNVLCFEVWNNAAEAALLTGETLCPYVYELTYETMQKTERLASGILQRDPETVQALMEALVIIGIAMSYTGNSRPASGSEHHLSHYFEITGIVFGREYFLHGIDVAYSTVCTAAMRQRILETEALPVRLPAHDREHWLRAIRRNYGRAAEGVIALQDRCGYYADRYAALYRSQWADIRAVLAEMPSAAYIRQLLHTAGLDYAEFEAQYGKPLIRDAMLYAKDLKDRYTFLWIYYLLFSEEMQE